MTSRRDFGKSLAASFLAAAPALSILLGEEASPSEKWAADQLALHLEQMTGYRPAVANTSRSRRVIAVGAGALTRKLGVRVPAGESCLLHTKGETMIIAGGRDRGTIYGVFVFLEKLGCRWFTEDISHIPKLARFSPPRLNEVVAPAFAYREVFFTEAQGREWSARNRLNGNFHRLDESTGGKISYMPFAHAFYELVPPDIYFASHPEYFALVAGKRRREHAQLCLTNPAVVRIAVEQVRRWLNDRPDISVVSVSQNDGGGWCECDPCRAVVDEEGGAMSGLTLRFANEVAGAVALSHPGKIVDTLAYQATADPPSKARPLGNVQIRYSPIEACEGHSFQTCPWNRYIKAQLLEWARIAPRLSLWHYSINFAHFLAPFPNYRELISDIAFFKRIGVSGVFLEGAVSDGGGGNDAELRSYLVARLLWNPTIDPAAEIQAFLDAVYGPAAPAMAQYFAAQPDGHLWVDQNALLDTPRDLLTRAHSSATTDAARRRIERHLLSLNYIETIRKRRCRIDGAIYSPADLARVKADTRTFIEQAEGLGITHLREGYPIAQQARDLEGAAKSYAVLTISNRAITAVIAPELGARVIFLAHAGETSNRLREPDPGEFAYPRAGGIHIDLGPAYLTVSEPIDWTTASASSNAAVITGRSARGLAIEKQIELKDTTLEVRVSVSNPTSAPLPIAVRCMAEFSIPPSTPAPDGVSTETAADESILTLAGVAPGFSGDEPSRRTLSWSLRGDPRLSLGASSPETLLSPGASLTLRANYVVSPRARHY